MKPATRHAIRLLHWLGPLLLAVLIWRAHPARLWAVARTVNPWWLLMAWALNVPQLGIKAFRWWLNVRWQGIRLPYGRAFLAYFSSVLVGFLTPGRVGEVVKAFTLKYECGVPLALGFSSVVLDRAFDLYLLLALGSLGIARYSLVGTLFSRGTLAAVALMFLVPVCFLHAGVARRAGALVGRMMGKKGIKIREKADQFADGLASMTPGRLALLVLLTVAAYAIFFVQCLLCAWALHFSTPFLDLVFLMAVTNLVTFIPISISGLGTREASLKYFLGQIRPPQPAPVAVAYGLVILLVFFIGGGLIGYLCWQWAPIGLRRAVRDVRTARAGQGQEKEKVD